MIVKDVPIEMESPKGVQWCTKDTYICEEETPCMVVDYVYCTPKKEIVDIIIRRAYTTYYTSSAWIQHKQIPLCDACEVEQQRARGLGVNVRIHYIDPPIARILKRYLKGEGGTGAMDDLGDDPKMDDLGDDPK